MTYAMRAPCRTCGTSLGYMRRSETGMQDMVYCSACGRHQYNAPYSETGRAPRTKERTHKGIRDSHRYRVIERAQGRCDLCGRGPSEGLQLHVGHVISVDEGHAEGMTDFELNSLDNLICLCSECNLGQGRRSLPVRLLVKLITIRAKRQHGEGG